MKPGLAFAVAFRSLALAGLVAVAGCNPAPGPSVDAPTEAPPRRTEPAPVVPPPPSAPALQPSNAAEAQAIAPSSRDRGPRPDDAGRSNRLPLARILDIVLANTPGEVLEVELEEDDGVEAYEINILTRDDRTIEITVDARTGRILEREED